VTQKVRITNPKRQEIVEFVEPEESERPLGKVHACEASWRGYQLARDRLKRADRDLGETAAFIAASLTTVTAIQAVISIAKEQLELSNQVLQLVFNSYIAIFVLILLLGVFRTRSAMQRRARAERDIDQAKKGIIDCPCLYTEREFHLDFNSKLSFLCNSDGYSNGSRQYQLANHAILRSWQGTCLWWQWETRNRS
jgi:hypothetical protein